MPQVVDDLTCLPYSAPTLTHRCCRPQNSETCGPPERGTAGFTEPSMIRSRLVYFSKFQLIALRKGDRSSCKATGAHACAERSARLHHSARPAASRPSYARYVLTRARTSYRRGGCCSGPERLPHSSGTASQPLGLARHRGFPSPRLHPSHRRVNRIMGRPERWRPVS
jgi:hypothetical protein